MILDSITLTDFGLYAGRQEIRPSPTCARQADRPLRRPQRRRQDDPPRCAPARPSSAPAPRPRAAVASVTPTISPAASTTGLRNRRAAIQLNFRHTTDGAEDRYTLRRAWREDVGGKCREEFRVLKNDRLASTLADNWVAQVDNLLPYNIAHLFLFDGEQIERYASPDEAATLIGTAIQNLLGLDLVEQLDKDIRVYERRKSAERLDGGGRAQLLEAEKELRRLRERLLAVKQQRAALQTHHIVPRRRELRTIEDEFRRLGGDLFERRTGRRAGR